MTLPPEDQAHLSEEPTQAVDRTGEQVNPATQEVPTTVNPAVASKSIDNNDENSPVATNAYALDSATTTGYATTPPESKWTPSLVIGAIVVAGLFLLLAVLLFSFFNNDSNEETPTSTTTSTSTSSTTSTTAQTTTTTVATTTPTTAPTTTAPATTVGTSPELVTP